ncbi:MAG: hypothetical protein ACR2NR_13770, partial [Solirubrobacteraceae bacterium]
MADRGGTGRDRGHREDLRHHSRGAQSTDTDRGGIFTDDGEPGRHGRDGRARHRCGTGGTGGNPGQTAGGDCTHATSTTGDGDSTPDDDASGGCACSSRDRTTAAGARTGRHGTAT